MSIQFQAAIRDRVSLVIGLVSASGGGKSLSALKIARGLAGGDDTKIAFIDSESGRAKHYAPAPGEKPTTDRFGFMHGDLRAPFSPEAYIEAITAADKEGFEVIVVDSYSHSWDGEGGMQDIHSVLVEEMVERARGSQYFDETKTRERVSLGAWADPKTRNRRMVSRLLQCRAHIIICMRADEKLLMETVEEEGSNGRKYKKTVITPAKDRPIEERWVPICEKRFPYELTLSLLLVPSNPGFPIPLKLQEQHKKYVPLDRFLSEETGRGLAEWARGGAPVGSNSSLAEKKTTPPTGANAELLSAIQKAITAATAKRPEGVDEKAHKQALMEKYFKTRKWPEIEVMTPKALEDGLFALKSGEEIL